MQGCRDGVVGTAALTSACALCSPSPLKQLENVCWQRDGRLIVSCHSDGSYCQWPMSSDTQQPEPLRNCMPYGQWCPHQAQGLVLPCHLGPSFSQQSILSCQSILPACRGGYPAHRGKTWGPERCRPCSKPHSRLSDTHCGSLSELLRTRPPIRGPLGGCGCEGFVPEWTHMPLTVGGPLKLIPFILGPFPCKAITKIFWLTTKQG